MSMEKIYCFVESTRPFFLLIRLSALRCTHSPMCRLPEYTRCRGAKHPLGLQHSQTEGSGGGEGGENDKRAHGGSWGQLKIARGRGGESDEKSAGTTMRETQAGLYLAVLRMKCFAVRTGEESIKSMSPRSNQTLAIFWSGFITNKLFFQVCCHGNSFTSTLLWAG